MNNHLDGEWKVGKTTQKTDHGDMTFYCVFIKDRAGLRGQRWSAISSTMEQEEELAVAKVIAKTPRLVKVLTELLELTDAATPEALKELHQKIKEGRDLVESITPPKIIKLYDA